FIPTLTVYIPPIHVLHQKQKKLIVFHLKKCSRWRHSVLKSCKFVQLNSLVNTRCLYAYYQASTMTTMAHSTKSLSKTLVHLLRLNWKTTWNSQVSPVSHLTVTKQN